jgi:transaldolase/glucose-6-phosphate isomerase
MNPLVEVQKFGQSIWYDNIRRGLITSGELMSMVEKDGLLGVTSNPAIFEKALAGSTDYDQATKALVAAGSSTAKDIFEQLAIQDIQLAADVLYAAFVRTNGKDGYVSLEVSPHLAHDTHGTLEEARRLHAAVRRDNVMIKVPATPAGIPAIRQLISEGINVNVTLLFDVDVYAKVAEAYMSGLEDRIKKRGDPSRIASVASFFISRIDNFVDDKLGQALDATRDNDRRAKLKSLVGKVAIANAKTAYAKFQDMYTANRWLALAATGAHPQRLLWASTSPKNPKYSPVLYVEELIGAETVNTLPSETYRAFRDGAKVRPALTENWAENVEQAREVLRTLAEVGISLHEATEALLKDAVKKFVEPFDKLMNLVEKKRQAILGGELDRQTYSVGDAAGAVQATLDDWRQQGKIRQIWSGDSKLWSNSDENRWLGWLHVVAGQQDHDTFFSQLAGDAKEAGFKHVVLLGMGGSSLCPEVLRKTFGVFPGFPELHVLDSTVPAQVLAVEKRIDLAHTLFIVSSKSGSTSETNAFKQYFYEKLKKQLSGSKSDSRVMDHVRFGVCGDTIGSHFIAITDPGTKLHQTAKSDRFRSIVYGVPSIGGRYSALSHFGMVPATLMGLNVPAFVDSTAIMEHSCASCVPPEMNPGVMLGALLGTLAKQGHDKVTFIISPAIASLGAWLEQLLAESTGKQGKGLIPIDGEQPGGPDVYGKDRLFVYIRLNSVPSADQDADVRDLEAAGQPVIRIALEEAMDLGQEFFRWEVATAVAGAIFGINPFDQPDVEASKIATRKLTAAYEETGKLPQETPIVQGDGISLFADEKNANALRSAASSRSVEAYLAAHMARLQPGDFFAVNAYVEMNDANGNELQLVRQAVRDAKKVATTLGYGPRFLHSTGQLHKGGPNSGLFLQITTDDKQDLPIPGQKYTFGVLKHFQAQGDFDVLSQRGRRALRVHLGSDVAAGLARLRELIQWAVA